MLIVHHGQATTAYNKKIITFKMDHYCGAASYSPYWGLHKWLADIELLQLSHD